MYIAECRAMGIRVLTPDINRSVTDFAALAPLGGARRASSLPVGSPGAITFGLSAVRNVGAGLVALLLEERDANGPFASFHDFVERVPEPVLNKRAVESLIKAGAFDSLGHTRKGLLGVFEHITDTTLTRRRERERGVMSLFGDWGGAEAEAAAAFDERLPIPDVEFDKSDKLRNEKEMLGLYVSDHPLFGVGGGAAPQGRALDRRPRRAGRREHGAHRRGDHRADPEVHQEGRPDGGVRARGPRGEHRGDAVPPHAAGARPQAAPTTSSSPSRAASTAATRPGST